MASAAQLLLDALRLQPTAEADEFALHSGGGSLSERALPVFLNAQDAEGQTALHVACRDGHTALASVMLAAGADPGVCDLELNTAVSAAVRPSISIDNKQLDSKRLENRNVLVSFSLSLPPSSPSHARAGWKRAAQNTQAARTRPSDVAESKASVVGS